MRGMLPMTTATKVSRTAQEPACWAPPMGSWGGRKEVVSEVVQVRQREVKTTSSSS